MQYPPLWLGVKSQNNKTEIYPFQRAEVIFVKAAKNNQSLIEDDQCLKGPGFTRQHTQHTSTSGRNLQSKTLVAHIFTDSRVTHAHLVRQPFFQCTCIAFMSNSTEHCGSIFVGHLTFKPSSCCFMWLYKQGIIKGPISGFIESGLAQSFGAEQSFSASL